MCNHARLIIGIRRCPPVWSEVMRTRCRNFYLESAASEQLSISGVRSDMDHKSKDQVVGAGGEQVKGSQDQWAMRRSVGSADGDNDYLSLLLNTLDRIGCGGLILDRNQKLISANSVAVEILKRRNLPTEGSSFTSAVEELLRSLSASSAPDEAAWVTAWREYEQPLAVFRVPSNEANHVILVLVDIQTRLQPNARVLRQMFGLTSAESKLASGIALGFSPEDLSQRFGVQKTTVRTQLASVFSKT